MNYGSVRSIRDLTGVDSSWGYDISSLPVETYLLGVGTSSDVSIRIGIITKDYVTIRI